MHSYVICRIILLDIVDLNTLNHFLTYYTFYLRKYVDIQNNCNGRISILVIRKEKDKSIVHIPFRDK